MKNSQRIYKPGGAMVANVNIENHGDENNERIPSFPIEHLPPVARIMAEAVTRTARTPEALAGCCVLGILSASIGAGLQVPSHSGRMTRGNLYILASAASGTGKSETFRPIAEPFFDFQRDLTQRWEKETLPTLSAEADLLETEIAKLKKDANKSQCRSNLEREAIREKLKAKKLALAAVTAGLNSPCLCCEDVTSQKLAVMLDQNGEQLASLSSDAGNIVNILLGQYSKLDRTDESIYLKAFSGDNCRVDRQGREPVLLRRPCLTALWLVQPDKTKTVFAEQGLTDGGLTPRMLVCDSNAQHQPIVRDVDGISAATTKDWTMLVRGLIGAFRMAKEIITITPMPEVLQLMDAHYNKIILRINDDLQDVSTYACRWNEQAWRIAVCLHAGLHGEDAGVEMMSADTGTGAIAIAEWFAGQQLRILEGGRRIVRRNQRDEILGLLANNPINGITARDVHRARIVARAAEAHDALALMEADGELVHTESKPEGGGHVMLIYTKAER